MTNYVTQILNLCQTFHALTAQLVASIRCARSSDVSSFGLIATSVFLCVFGAGCGRNERMDLIYGQRCASCHGPGGRGDGQIAASLETPPPDFRETVQRKSNSQIRKVIAEGKGSMPAFDPALRPSEVNDMLQMVRFLSREGRDLAWWEKYDTLITAHCSIPWEAVLGLDDPPEKKP